MATFADRLKLLRNNKKLTQKEIAKILNINERSYQNYEINASTPNFKLLLFIADYFDVSIDYLVGKSEIKERR
ncbi:DNA-binding transcriptional regulator, XRE-family HTH domain [Propionispira arboris]|uniref:DNA-binding transcriptional regulator, XRE-family HTH domain n=1 Tax=Propionispira arboris TaxID=84035 RepID=A0A1H7C9F3_9FIRM|nr:helix-turn-helix transcriptional regulator [Propionispira arboris]SEJ82275.1 DNA-binding transcriptional regulator, XRE-family HTH domain [Propionispira arboris]